MLDINIDRDFIYGYVRPFTLEIQVTLHKELIVMQVTLHNEIIVMQVTLHNEIIEMQVTLHNEIKKNFPCEKGSILYNSWIVHCITLIKITRCYINGAVKLDKDIINHLYMFCDSFVTNLGLLM